MSPNREKDVMSVTSSPLTSLSSLDEEEDVQFQLSSSKERLISLDDLRTAQASHLDVHRYVVNLCHFKALM